MYVIQFWAVNMNLLDSLYNDLMWPNINAKHMKTKRTIIIDYLLSRIYKIIKSNKHI